LSLAVLLMAALFLLTRTDPVDRANRKILLESPDAADSVVLAGLPDTVRLVRAGDAWKAGGKEINQVAVDNLLYAACNLRIASFYNRPLEDTGQAGIRVSYYKSGRPLLAYRVVPGEGRLLLFPDMSGNGYRVELPGYAGHLGEVFTSDIGHYSEHRLIDLLPSEIRYVEVERKGEEPFRISMDENGDFSCRFPASDSTLDEDLLDDLALRLLFSYFTNIRYDERLRDTGAGWQWKPGPERFLARLTVDSAKGDTHQLEIYSMPADDGSGDHIYKAVIRYNGHPELLVVNYIYLDVLMRPLGAYYVDKG